MALDEKNVVSIWKIVWTTKNIINHEKWYEPRDFSVVTLFSCLTTEIRKNHYNWNFSSWFATLLDIQLRQNCTKKSAVPISIFLLFFHPYFKKSKKLTLHQDIKSNWHIQIRSLVCPPWRNKPKQSLHSRLKSQICRRVLHFFGSHRRYNTFRYLKTWFFQGSALKVYLDNDFLSLFRLSEIIIPFS